MHIFQLSLGCFCSGFFYSDPAGGVQRGGKPLSRGAVDPPPPCGYAPDVEGLSPSFRGLRVMYCISRVAQGSVKPFETLAGIEGQTNRMSFTCRRSLHGVSTLRDGGAVNKYTE